MIDKYHPSFDLKEKEIEWQRVRIEAAIAAMNGMLACRGGGDATTYALVSVEYADALVTELQKKEVVK